MPNIKHIRFNTHRIKSYLLLKLVYLLNNQDNNRYKDKIEKLVNLFKRYISGATGEESVLGLQKHYPGCLMELPNQFIIFNQLNIRYGKAARELDYVILGPTGLFIVEVKNNKGIISGTENCETWKQAFDKSEETYRVRNPTKQVSSAATVFSLLLSAYDITTPIQKLVVYSNPSVTLNNEDTNTPVLRLSELSNYILTAKNTLLPAEYINIYQFLISLHKQRVSTLEMRKLGHDFKQYRLSETGPIPLNLIMHDLVRHRVKGILNHNYRKSWKTDDITPKDITNDHLGTKQKRQVNKFSKNRASSISSTWNNTMDDHLFTELAGANSYLDEELQSSQTKSDDEFNLNHILNSLNENANYWSCMINPATGLPLDNSYDIAGNPFGSDLHDSMQQTDTSNTSQHDDFFSIETGSL